MKNLDIKKVKRVTVVIILFLCFNFGANAQWVNYNGMPIAYWDFQNTATNPTTFQTTVKQQINSGNTFDGKFGGVSTTTTGVVGDGITVYGGAYAGKALSAGGWSNATTDPGIAATTYYQFSLNTTGFTGIQVGMDVKGSGSSHPYSSICYSTNGGITWVAGGALSTSSAWTYAAAYSFRSGADNNANLKIRIYGWWSNNSTGSTLVVDNLMVLATGTVANAGTLNLLNEQDIISSCMPGYVGYSNRTNFTAVGPNTNIVVNNNYNTVYGSPYYNEIGMQSGKVFAITAGATVTFGSMGDITNAGQFSIASGCTLVTAHPNGISASGNSTAGNGSVTVAGTKTYDPGANYTFNGTAAQITNGGLPATLTGTLTFSNSSGVSLSGSISTNTSITLQSGALILNGYTLTETNTSTTAILSTGGYIQSETNLAQNPSIITWSMASGTLLTYIFPFGSSGSLLPFTFTKTTSGTVNVSVSTRHTGADNTPLAGASDGGTIPAVSNMTCGGGGNATSSVIDRWWDINTSAAVTADLTFSYIGTECSTMDLGYQTGIIKAQHWNGTSWDLPVGTGVGVTSGVGTCVVLGAHNFSPWVLTASGNPLPIELTNFESACDNNAVKLTWTTATEINNSHFIIQRSEDGHTYSDILKINGAGNSNEARQYSTFDESPLAGLSYYRLKQVDYNGQSTVFPGIVSNCGGTTGFNLTNIIPDAGSKTAKLLFNSSEKTKYSISIYDMLGNKLMSTNNQSETGNNEVEISGAGLSHAIYIIQISTENLVISRKIIF